MIDLKSTYVRAVLQGVTQRVALAAEALDWTDGKQVFNEQELAPPITHEEDRDAWARFIKQVQSMGPRAFSHKRTAAIGSINWGGDDPGQIDDRLAEVDLEYLAVKALKSLVATGIAGVLPHQPEVGLPRLQNMGGYLEPLYDEDDVGGATPRGWLQVMSEPDGVKFRIRVYELDPADPTRGTLYEWRKASQPYEIGNAPAATWENVLMPTVVMADTAQDGTPIGELTQALPTLKGEVAQQIRILRASDANAYPLRWAAGDWDIPKERGALDVLIANETDATIGVLEAPLLEGLFTQHDRIMERVRGDLNLPISTINTGTFPSGEALDQANANSISTASMYARLLQRLLTGGVAGLAELFGIKRSSAPPVSVEINREQTRRMVTDQVRNDWREGLISFRAAVITVSQYYPAWADDEVEAFIREEEARENPRPPAPGQLDHRDDLDEGPGDDS